jgi:hypothetical protein
VAGADPTDPETFADAHLARLRAAVAELSWLLGRGYADVAASTLVGDHHQLTRRQRAAVRRCACADADLTSRLARRERAGGRPVAVDVLNQLVTLERGFAGGAVLLGRDGAPRDVAGVHGSWRRSERTDDALAALSGLLRGVDAHLVLDAPVSNSGRLAAWWREAGRGEAWEVELAQAADRRLLELAAEGRAVATSDAAILDRCGPWVSLIAEALPAGAWIVDLG